MIRLPAPGPGPGPAPLPVPGRGGGGSSEENNGRRQAARGAANGGGSSSEETNRAGVGRQAARGATNGGGSSSSEEGTGAAVVRQAGRGWGKDYVPSTARQGARGVANGGGSSSEENNGVAVVRQAGRGAAGGDSSEESSVRPAQTIRRPHYQARRYPYQRPAWSAWRQSSHRAYPKYPQVGRNSGRQQANRVVRVNRDSSEGD